MALFIWSDFKSGDRVMAGDCQRDIGTVREVKAGCDVAGWATVQWDSDGETSRIRADMLKPSRHVEDEAWEYLLDLLLSGEIDIANFRSQASSAGYCVEQINNAIDYNYEEIREQMVRGRGLMPFSEAIVDPASLGLFLFALYIGAALITGAA